MSTDPAFTVEWTVPSEDEEWGGDGPESSSDVDVEGTARTTSEDSDGEGLSGRDPANLPPAPVLAARVDHLRSERDAAEQRVAAVRDRYERVLAARNAEIRELRASRTRLQAFVDRLPDLR